MIEKEGSFYPDDELRGRAWVNNSDIYNEAAKDPLKFWEGLASNLFWFKKWQKTYGGIPPYFSWFIGGKINITTNIFEKNNLGWESIKKEIAVIWEPEPVNEETKTITYEELFNDVCRLSNALKKQGIKKGDVVGIYLPMIPEAVVSMLACARIGAVHMVVFSAFSPKSLRKRLKYAGAKILITADGYFRRGKIIRLKEKADEGIKETGVERLIVVKRMGMQIPWDKERDVYYQNLILGENNFSPAEEMDSEDPLFILPESGTTGEYLPIFHTTGGYTVQALWSGKWIFDFHRGDIFWSMANIGWVTGHSYTVYSPLLNGLTTLIFEGAPNWPEPDRWAKIIEKDKVSIFYTSPTAIRMFRKNEEIVLSHNFSSLRILASVGEPLDEASWHWFFKKVGGGKIPLLDTYWQTETGSIIISSLPGVGPFRAGFVGLPFPGVMVGILDDEGKKCPKGKPGNLVLLPPFFPSFLRGIWENGKLYRETYFKMYGKEVYFSGDKALESREGLIKVLGRADDIIKIAGHRLSIQEIESAINSLDGVSESAVVAVSDRIKGQVPMAFIKYEGKESGEAIKKEIKKRLRREIGPIAVLGDVYLVDELPKTDSGKIMRKLLRCLLTGEDFGDLSTLSNPKVIDIIKERIKAKAGPK